MKFSLYSEIQSWPGKSAEQLYGEVLEQIQNADRLGYDAYAVIEHFFFPKFSVSANPLALFAAAAQRTKRINFRTLLHSMPYHNPVVLASEIAVADILLEGRYEFGVGRGHGWMPPKAGLPLTPESRERYEESVELLFEALENERFSYDGKHFQIGDSGIVPRPDRQVPRLPRRHLRPHVRARRRARLGRRRAAAPAVRRARRAARPLSRQVRGARQRAGHRLDPRLLHRRGSRGREARGEGLDGEVPAGERVAADRIRPAARRRAERGRLRLLHSRDPRKAGGDAVRGDDRGRHRLGRHPVRRDRADRGRAGGLRRADRDLDHRQRGRCRPLEGDQVAGALRPHGDAALPGASSGRRWPPARDRARVRRRSRRDRQPLRGSSEPRRRCMGAHPPAGARACPRSRGSRGERPRRVHRARSCHRRPGGAAGVRRRDRGDEGDGARRGGTLARRPVRATRWS